VSGTTVEIPVLESDNSSMVGELGTTVVVLHTKNT
jgi:hypothetical protein